MQKLMIYSSDKTDSENTKIFEQIIGDPPADSSGGSGSGSGSGNRQSAPAVQIPSELGNEEGVKKFQDWLDANKPGWATGYADGKVNKGRGYGRFGPRTSKAWTTHKDAYLNPVNTDLVPELQGVTTNEPVYVDPNAKVEVSSDLKPEPVDAQQSTVSVTQTDGDITSNI